PQALEREAAEATRRSVEKQLECAIDVGNDGEQPRESFVTYLRYRLGGFFSGKSPRPPGQDLAAYPSFRALMQSQAPVSLPASPPRAPAPRRHAPRRPPARE